MATIGYELIKLLSVLNAGRVAPPQFDSWRLLGDRTPVLRDPDPSSVTDGIDVSEAIKGWVGTRTSDNAATWRMYLKPHTADAGETYGVNFFAGTDDAFEVSAAGDADIAVVVSNLQTAFDLSAEFALAGGVADQPATNIIRLTFTGLRDDLRDNAPVQVGVGTVTGIGFQSLIPEATRATWQLWALTLGTGEWARTPIRGTSKGPQDLMKVCEFAGVARHYIQVVDANGIVLPVYAPAVNETDRATAEQAAAQGLTALQAALLTILPNDYIGRLPDVSHDGQAFATPLQIRGAAIVTKDEPVYLQLTSMVVLSANPARRGFQIRANLDNPATVHHRYQAQPTYTASSADMQLAAGEVFDGAGDDIPGSALMMVSVTTPVADDWNVLITAIGANLDTHVVTVLGQSFTHVSDGVELFADQVDDLVAQIDASGLPVTTVDNGNDFDIIGTTLGQPLRVTYAQTGTCAATLTNTVVAVGDRVNVREW